MASLPITPMNGKFLSVSARLRMGRSVAWPIVMTSRNDLSASEGTRLSGLSECTTRRLGACGSRSSHSDLVSAQVTLQRSGVRTGMSAWAMCPAPKTAMFHGPNPKCGSK